MNIERGTRLGPYEIVSPLGAGGMGEVWRAKDTRLDRSVAIKVLSAEFAADAQLKVRFEREAKTISQLEHPHICRLYDVGEAVLTGGADGVVGTAPPEGGAASRRIAGEAAGAPLSYLVMELLEGESLADRITRGPLPLAEVVRYGAQIAAALDAAHRQGVVHRDLKPGNIMLTKSGAKLLDFGLAKNAGAATLTAPLNTTLETQQKPLTEQGTIVGTFHYMAPEQLEGREADARTDIFALGTVLYEMITGQRTFGGNTRASLIASIVGGTPRPMAQLQPLTPPLLEHVVLKCLEKNPDDRWQSVHDVGEELRWIGAGISVPAAAAEAIRPRRKREWIAWVAAAVAVIAAVAGWIAFVGERTSAERPLRFLLPAPRETAFGDAVISVSPDGQQIAFLAEEAGKLRIWIRSFDRAEPRAIEGTDGARLPFWSPDGFHLGFFADGKLKRVDVRGGSPQTICEIGASERDVRGASWGRDGTILFAPHYELTVHRVPADGGKPTQLTHVNRSRGETSHRWPHVLPDGKHFLYVTRGLTDEKQICVAGMDGKEIREIGTTDSRVVWVAPGYLLFVRDDALVAQRFDLGKLELSGAPQTIAEGLVRSTYATGLSAFDATESVLAFRRGSARTRLTWFDRSGKILGVVGGESDDAPALSPDGGRVAVERLDRSNSSDLWMIDLKRDVASRFTFGPSDEYSPAWSPDGEWAVYFARNPRRICRKPTSGAGTEEVLYEEDPETLRGVTDWSRDGRFVVFGRATAGTKWDVWILDVAGNAPRARPLLRSPFSEMQGRLSPDGRFVAYLSDESGRPEIYVQTFPEPTGKWQISTGGGRNPNWRGDGGELYYLALDGKVMAVKTAAAGPSLAFGTPQLLFQTVPMGFGQSYTVTNDGGRFLVDTADEKALSEPITVAINWRGELK